MVVTIRQVYRAPAAPSRALVFAITIASLEPGAADETPRVHIPRRRRGRGMAARGARAAGSDAGDRVSQRPVARGYRTSGGGISTRLGRNRLLRGTQRDN